MDVTQKGNNHMVQSPMNVSEIANDHMVQDPMDVSQIDTCAEFLLILFYL
jgi:hypothetical protein